MRIWIKCLPFLAKNRHSNKNGYFPPSSLWLPSPSSCSAPHDELSVLTFTNVPGTILNTLHKNSQFLKQSHEVNTITTLNLEIRKPRHRGLVTCPRWWQVISGLNRIWTQAVHVLNHYTIPSLREKWGEAEHRRTGDILILYPTKDSILYAVSF